MPPMGDASSASAEFELALPPLSPSLPPTLVVALKPDVWLPVVSSPLSSKVVTLGAAERSVAGDAADSSCAADKPLVVGTMLALPASAALLLTPAAAGVAVMTVVSTARTSPRVVGHTVLKTFKEVAAEAFTVTVVAVVVVIVAAEGVVVPAAAVVVNTTTLSAFAPHLPPGVRGLHPLAQSLPMQPAPHPSPTQPDAQSLPLHPAPQLSPLQPCAHR